MDKDNKDYILNIRLSRDTYEKVKNLAKKNAESVSHLVRKAIHDGLDIASDISEDIFGKEKKMPNITSYHQGIAAQDLICADCGARIKAGEKVTIGENHAGNKYYYCTVCK
jgi:hypothetical protein